MSSQESTSSKIPNAPYVRRHKARRHEDKNWHWQRVISFMSSDDFDKLPHAIQDIILDYTEKDVIWE